MQRKNQINIETNKNKYWHKSDERLSQHWGLQNVWPNSLELDQQGEAYQFVVLAKKGDFSI